MASRSTWRQRVTTRLHALIAILSTSAFVGAVAADERAAYPPPSAIGGWEGPDIAAVLETPVAWRDSWGTGELALAEGTSALRMLLPYAELATLAYCDGIYQPQSGAPESAGSDEACERFLSTRSGSVGETMEGEVPPGEWIKLKTYAHAAHGTRHLHGLRFITFMRHFGPDEPVEIVFAFRGTDFSSFSDWHANLRWVLPGRDQYHVLSEMAGLILDDARKLAQQRLQRTVTRWRMTATGHSLGGALAQLFAYKREALAAVVAFAPSPVTGFHAAVHDHEVNCNVPILRVYERGEVLSYLRRLTRQFYRLSENIVELEFQLLGGNPIFNHSMPRFYESMKARLANPIHSGAMPPPSAAPREASITRWRPDCTCSAQRRPGDFWTAPGTPVARICHEFQARPPSRRPFLELDFDPARPAP